MSGIVSTLIQPKEITILGGDGVERKFIISKIPYASGGREICSQYLPTAMPKVGDYPRNEELFLKMMRFVHAIRDDGVEIPLSTKANIDQCVFDFQTGVKLEKEVLEYNLGFFDFGKIYASLGSMTEASKPLIAKILTLFQAFLSQKDGQPSKNSKKTTP